MKRLLAMLGAMSLALISTVTFAGSSSAASAGTATVSVVHGIPDTPVNVFVNGKSTLADFKPGTVAGPLTLPAGSYHITVFAASNTAGTGTPVISASATLTAGENVTLVAHLTADGTPTITPFVNDVTPIPAGDGRLVVRHTAAAPAVDVRANGKVAFSDLTNPHEAKADLPAGTVSADVVLTGTDTVVLGPANVAITARNGDHRLRRRFGLGEEPRSGRADHRRAERRAGWSSGRQRRSGRCAEHAGVGDGRVDRRCRPRACGTRGADGHPQIADGPFLDPYQPAGTATQSEVDERAAPAREGKRATRRTRNPRRCRPRPRCADGVVPHPLVAHTGESRPRSGRCPGRNAAPDNLGSPVPNRWGHREIAGGRAFGGGPDVAAAGHREESSAGRPDRNDLDRPGIDSADHIGVRAWAGTRPSSDATDEAADRRPEAGCSGHPHRCGRGR